MTIFQDKVVWITGAGTGIGRAAAHMYAREGATIGLMGRREGILEGVYDQVCALGGHGDFYSVDVADRARVNEVAAELLKRFKRVDVLVNNAGLNVRDRKLEVLTPEGWDEVINVNLTGALNMIHAVLPTMRKQRDGLIVNISSMAGKRVSGVGGAAYTASKHGMNGLSLSVSAEEAPNGIRCTAIMPGLVNTDILQKRQVTYDEAEKASMIQPEDIADAIRFLTLLPPRSTVPELSIVPTQPRQMKPGESVL